MAQTVNPSVGRRALYQLRDVPQYIQGYSGGIYTTLGNDSMSDSKQIVHTNMDPVFERLRSYDRLKLGIEGNDY